jgi:WD40 repeat protein
VKVPDFLASGVKVWDLQSGTPVFAAPGESTDFALSPDGLRLATMGRDGLTLWDVATGRECLARAGRGTPTFSPDSTCLAWTVFANRENRIHVTDIRTGAELMTAPVRGSLPRVAFSPDGTRLAVPEPAPLMDVLEIAVWEVATGRRLCRLLCPSGQVRDMAFSPDGRRIATLASPPDREQSQMRLWDVAAGHEVLTLDAQRRLEFGTRLTFSRDGRRLLADGRLFDETEYQEVWDATPRGDEGRARQ